MPHVQPLTIDQAPQDSKELLSATKEKYGKLLNIFGTMAYQPDVLKGVAAINDGIGNDLDPKLRELAYYTVSQLNGCEYCSHYHEQAAKKAGVTDSQLHSVLNGANSSDLDDHERAVVSYATRLTQTTNVDAATVNALKEFLSDEALVSLAATVALANFTNRFNHGLDVQLP